MKSPVRILIAIISLLSASCHSDMDEVLFGGEGHSVPIRLSVAEGAPHTRAIVNSISDISVSSLGIYAVAVLLPAHFLGFYLLY